MIAMTTVQTWRLNQAQIWAAKEIPTRCSTYWLHQEMKRQRAIRLAIDTVISLRPETHLRIVSLQTVLGMMREADPRPPD